MLFRSRSSGRDISQTITEQVSVSESPTRLKSRVATLSEQLAINESAIKVTRKAIVYVPRVFQSGVFQEYVFQKEYSPRRVAINPVFQSIFQNRVFQKSYNFEVIPKVFQENVFQTYVFQNAVSSKVNVYAVFQSGVFQQYVFNVFKKVKQSLSDTETISETTSVRKETNIYRTINESITISATERTSRSRSRSFEIPSRIRSFP